MNKETLFECWAPAAGKWSDWVKPVLFAHWNGSAPQTEGLPPQADVSLLPAADTGTALVLDLPGPQGVAMGLQLARRGYRPIPLYNASPPPQGVLAVVDVQPILLALARGAQSLAETSLPPDASPAFLLDANRRWGHRRPLGGQFDNRSVSFPTDFPSASHLKDAGIRNVLLVQEMTRHPQEDLAHTLRLWQQGGLNLELLTLTEPSVVMPLNVPRPSVFGWIGFRIRMLLRLTRNPLGGYGGLLPIASAG